ncbi:MAG: hypothetical protein R2875_10045 [Desulfobacterales bacterium]
MADASLAGTQQFPGFRFTTCFQDVARGKAIEELKPADGKRSARVWT